MIFDQYSRYKACADLLRQAGYAEGSTVLDVGSGPECLFGQFLPDASMNYVDPLISEGSDQGRISGTVFSSELDNSTFDCVSAVDVLEHVPPEHRLAFLERLSSLAGNALILGFPASDSTDATAVDHAIEEQYKAVFHKDYPWLEEHYRFGLPSLSQTVRQLEQMGWHCQTIGHAHAPWLQRLLGFVICAWDIPGLKDVVLEISDEFNRNLYQFDFREPYYRQFIIATRAPVQSIAVPDTGNSNIDVDTVFLDIMKDARDKYFNASLQQLVEREDQITALNQKAEELSQWGESMQPLIADRDAQIDGLSRNIEEISAWTRILKSTIADKDVEITGLSEKLGDAEAVNQSLEKNITELESQLDKFKQEVEEISGSNQSLQSTLQERDENIIALEQKLQDEAAANRSLNSELDGLESRLSQLDIQLQQSQASNSDLLLIADEREKQISALHEQNTLLEQDVTAKHTELMEMSDWAYSMMQELNQFKAPLKTRLRHSMGRYKARVRSRLSRTYLGSMVRYMRDSRKYRENMTSLASLKESIESSNGNLIITFPIITWDFRWQRPQHIVTRLRDHGFVIVYLAMTLAPLSRRFRGNKEAGALLRFNALAKNISQVWLHTSKQLNIYTDPVEGDDLNNLVQGLEAMLRELKPVSVHYLLQFPGWWPVVRELKRRLGGKVVFDCMDDHGGFSTNTSQALKTEQELIEQADLVITSSAVLEDRCRVMNPHTIQVKNGTEFDHFHKPKRNGQLDHLADCPIIGYYGAISDWFDMDIVAFCARQRPDWNFVLIGATFGADMLPVTGLDNVYFPGEMPYQDLPGCLAYFDVCTIPFKIIPLTLATNPVKFYEYLSAGKPVVSVELPELLDHSEDCYLAQNAEDFLAKLDQAYAERNDAGKIKRRTKLASNNSWDSRVNSILDSDLF